MHNIVIKILNNKMRFERIFLVVLMNVLRFPWIASAAPDTCQGLVDLIEKVGFAMEAIIGSIAVIMVLVAAFHYMTAGDDAQKVKKAHQTIAYAVIGLIVATLSSFVDDIVISFVETSLGECPS